MVVIGRVEGMGRVLAIGTLLLSSVAALGQQEPGNDLGELMRQLAARRHGEVSFVEQHFLKLLKRPAESYGELTYDAPDRLEKRTVEPKAETLTLAGDVLTVVRGGRARTLDLKAYPTLAPFIESIRATLAGDLPSLERLFTVDFAGTLARWRLTLTPRDVQVAKTVSRVTIDGTGDTLTTVEIIETDGDRSLMTLRKHR
jgi:outer membrane lipoprotein carrier protein LolA